MMSLELSLMILLVKLNAEVYNGLIVILYWLNQDGTLLSCL